jgi:hypothetical protein
LISREECRPPLTLSDSPRDPGQNVLSECQICGIFLCSSAKLAHVGKSRYLYWKISLFCVFSGWLYFAGSRRV